MNQPNDLNLPHLIRVCEEVTNQKWMISLGQLTVGDDPAIHNQMPAYVFATTFSPTAILSLLHRLVAAEKRAKLYDELIYAVESKHPNETRHETALRYIREREQPKDVQACKEA